jgi:Tol biopolymer transport system component
MLGGSKPQDQLRVGLSASHIRAQLEKILGSETFGRSERLSGFLRYVVEETLRGNSSTLKEQVIAHDLYRRGDGYDPNADPIVRVDARRLRDKLREYYAEADGESIVITLPKGSYVPSFERNSAALPVVVAAPGPEPVVIRAPPRSRPRIVWLASAVAMILAAGAAWYVLRPPVAALRVRPLTSLPGNESGASLSPDGNFVVFTWSNGGPPNLYIKAIDSETPKRLTESPGPEFSPAWSPDGREIAFIRGSEGVFITSPLGGAERKIAEGGNRVGWSADSKSVFLGNTCPGSTDTSCIYQIDLATLEKRQLTKAGNANPGLGFAASPDGKTLAVIRMGRPGICDVYLVLLSGGEPQRITTQNRFMHGVAWTPDSKHLFYSMLDGARIRLWRTAANGKSGNGQPVTALGESAVMPSVARSTGGMLRVAYHSILEDVSLRLVELKPARSTDPVGIATPFADATDGRDCAAKFSPDASHVLFGSFRTGEGRFWIAQRDGSGLRPLTQIVAQEGWPGDWSPDGRRIVFDLHADGNSDIYVTDPSGARPVRLTSEPSMDAAPAWSHDGRWIYFFSDRSGSAQIWKVPAAGAAATQLTFQGGFRPQPSIDGKYIYYVADLPGARRPNVLKRIPVGGGEESVVIGDMDVSPFHWTVTAKGIYLLTLDHRTFSGFAPAQGTEHLDRYDPATGQRERLGTLPFRTARGFCGFMSVSQDGRFLVANHVDRYESNLGLIDGLR